MFPYLSLPYMSNKSLKQWAYFNNETKEKSVITNDTSWLSFSYEAGEYTDECPSIWHRNILFVKSIGSFFFFLSFPFPIFFSLALSQLNQKETSSLVSYPVITFRLSTGICATLMKIYSN